MNRRYIHHFEHDDGSVVGIRSDLRTLSSAFHISMKRMHYSWLAVTVNPDL